MFTTVAVTLATIAFVAAVYYGWCRWFRDSEVNLIADIMTYAGLLAEFLILLDDPTIREFMVSAGIKPIWLIIFGLAVRFARRFRDDSMAVSKPYDPDSES